MNIKNRIFALIGLDMILPTNFIYREIFNDSPWTCCNDWIGEALKYEDVYNSYWWMWVFIIIAYILFTYKSEDSVLYKTLDLLSNNVEDIKPQKPINDKRMIKSKRSYYGFSGMEILLMIIFFVSVFSLVSFIAL